MKKIMLVSSILIIFSIAFATSGYLIERFDKVCDASKIITLNNFDISKFYFFSHKTLQDNTDLLKSLHLHYEDRDLSCFYKPFKNNNNLIGYILIVTIDSKYFSITTGNHLLMSKDTRAFGTLKEEYKNYSSLAEDGVYLYYAPDVRMKTIYIGRDPIALPLHSEVLDKNFDITIKMNFQLCYKNGIKDLEPFIFEISGAE